MLREKTGLLGKTEKGSIPGGQEKEVHIWLALERGGFILTTEKHPQKGREFHPTKVVNHRCKGKNT